MAITFPYEQTALSVTGTEVSLINGSTTLTANTTAGVYQLLVDGVANMVKGDEFVVRIYETVRASGTMRLVLSTTMSDVQTEALVMPNLVLGNGWQMTMQRVSASSRSFDSSIRKVG